MTIGLIKGVLSKLFPSFSYNRIINTKISLYNSMKKAYPRATENDILNRLILLRIASNPSVESEEKEYSNYEKLLKDSSKTLKQVIHKMVAYEYILRCVDDVSGELSKMGFSKLDSLFEIEDFLLEVYKEIESSIGKRGKMNR